MDAHLQILLSFPPHPPPHVPLSDQQFDEGIHKILAALRKMTPKNFTQPTSNGEHILDVINPALNTISYAFALAMNLRAANPLSDEVMFLKMTTFLEQFDPRQIRYVGHEYNLVISTVASFARRSQQPELALIPISNAILKLDPTASTFTSAHLTLAQLALESQVPRPALPVLDMPILFFPLSNVPSGILGSSEAQPPNLYITIESGLTEKVRYQDVLEYFLTAGTIYIFLQVWGKALEMLECVIAYPVKDKEISKIVVDAYKRWVLVYILHTGRAGHMTALTNPHVVKSLHILAKPYESLAAQFETDSALRVKQEAEAGNHIWSSDDNTGLVILVLGAYQKFQIRKLANIYRTISIAEVTHSTMSAETGNPLPNDQATEELVKDLISRGFLHATLSASVLTFDVTTSILSEEQVQIDLASTMTRFTQMAGAVKATDHQLTQDNEYQKWAYRQQKSKYPVDAGLDLAEHSQWEGGDDGDEDLMGSA